MLFEKYLMPDLYLPDIYSITPEILKEYGICAIVSDIDNTLVTYDDAVPTSKLYDWFELMSSAGIKISFISNNDQNRVDIFNQKLGYFGKGKAKKPSIKYIKKAMEYMSSTKSNTAILGDQLLTDAWAGKRAGLKAFIVPPIKDKTDLFHKFKRLIEKPYIRKYKRIHK